MKSLNYSFVSFCRLIWIFDYVLTAQISTSQAGPKFKTDAKGYERIIQDILRRSGNFSIYNISIFKKEITYPTRNIL